MGIKIFEVDPDAKPRKRFSEDIVGRFRSGEMLNNMPRALEQWRVTTGDPEVAAAIAEILGGDEASEWASQGEDSLQVYTDASSVDVLLDGPSSVQTAMALWGRRGLIHKCDGEELIDGSGPCPMAGKTVAERKEADKAGHGCRPDIQVYFKLADAEDLGKFRFTSGSWTMAGEIAEAEEALAKINGPARGTLSLEVVDYTTKGGRHVHYTKPVLKVTGAAA